MATRIGPGAARPEVLSVRKATDSKHYVFWGDEPAEASTAEW